MKKRGKRHFRVSPYLFQLIIFGIVGILLCSVLTIFFLFAQSDCSLYDFLTENLLSVGIVLCPLLVFFAVCINNSYEYFGYVEITDSNLICYAPFRKPLVFQYAYCHRINRLPINQSFVRIQFSEEIFNALLKKLPNDLYKRLYRSKTTEIN